MTLRLLISFGSICLIRKAMSLNVWMRAAARSTIFYRWLYRLKIIIRPPSISIQPFGTLCFFRYEQIFFPNHPVIMPPTRLFLGLPAACLVLDLFDTDHQFY